MPTLRLRYEGEFDYDEIYQFIATFFRTRNYDFFETRWKEKDATPAGREVTVVFKPTKKVTEYIQYKYKIEWKCADMHQTSDDLSFARFHLYVDYDVSIDWQGYKKQRPWLEKIYREYIVNTEIDDVHRAELGMEAQTLIDEINQAIGSDV